jgi:chlorophyll synthase
VAGLYALGAHGIMTLNDFKALEGDRATGVRSLPAVMGPEKAAKVACLIMALPQVVIVALLVYWDRPLHALAIAAVLGAQIWAMRIMMQDPKAKAPWYNATGVSLYVSGMMITAFAVRTLEVAP